MGMESARFAGAMGVGECTMCRMAPPEFARAVAFASYDNEIREMLHLLKFDGQRGLAEHVLGEWLAAAVLKLRDSASSWAYARTTRTPDRFSWALAERVASAACTFSETR